MDALEALKQFKSTGETKQVSRFKPSPTLKFSKKGGEFVTGKLVKYRALPEGSKAGKAVIDIQLDQTNAAFTIRNGDTYDAVEVKTGDVVSIFAPTALDNLIKNVALETDVYIRCDGKVKEVRNNKTVEFYKFDVRHR